MLEKKENNLYDDENIPRIDLPGETDKNSDSYSNRASDLSTNRTSDVSSDLGSYCECQDVEPLPESARPRKDGPGGE